MKLGLPRENIWVTDLAGVVWKGRTELMDPDKHEFAQETKLRTLAEVIVNADVFLGLSAGGVLKPAMVQAMAAKPLIFALANPTPEIMPEEVQAVRSDAVMATGRTDYPNQVNNVLCFPYIFRGALDCGATTITDQMEVAAVHAIAELAQAEQSDVVAAAYAGTSLSFGPDYLIPKPFDPRLMMRVAPAVAKAAHESGVAVRPIADLEAYRDKLQTFVYASGTTMKPIFTLAKRAARKKRGVLRGRRGARAARGAGGGRRRPRPPDLDRPAGGDRAALREVRPAAAGRARLRRRQHRARPPLPRLLADLPPADRTQGRDGAAGQDRDAAPADADRLDAAAQGRGRRHDLRHLGHARPRTWCSSTRSSASAPASRPTPA